MGKWFANDVDEEACKWADEETTSILDKLFADWSYEGAQFGWEFTVRAREIQVWVLVFLTDAHTGEPTVVPGGREVVVPEGLDHDYNGLYHLFGQKLHGLFDALARHEVMELFKVRKPDGTLVPVYDPHGPGLSHFTPNYEQPYVPEFVH